MLDHFLKKKKNLELAVSSEYHTELPHHASISDSKLYNIYFQILSLNQIIREFRHFITRQPVNN